MGALESRQNRWAHASAQNAMKLLPRVRRSTRPGSLELEAVFHLTVNAGYVVWSLSDVGRPSPFPRRLPAGSR
jgi:hypothetical protein